MSVRKHSLVLIALAILVAGPHAANAQYTITTVAGNGSSIGFPNDNAKATNVALSPLGIAVDKSGNLYILDRGSANASGPRPSAPRKVGPNGIITTVGCNGSQPVQDNVEATGVDCGNLFGVAVDNSGNVFVTEVGGHLLDRIDASGIIHIPLDGLESPSHVVVDNSGNAYVADTGDCRVIKFLKGSPPNVDSTVAGIGNVGVNCGFSGDHGPASAAELLFPQGVAVDHLGNVYIADSNNLRVRKVDTSGVITTVAGNGTACLVNDSPVDNVPAVESGVCPTGVAVDAAGNLYIADFGSGRIRKVNTSGIITTIAGGGTNGLGDGGPATSAELQFPFDVIVDDAGNLYVSDSGNFRVRLLTPAVSIVRNLKLTTSGFLFSHVTGTFNGTILISNVGNRPTPDSLQLVLAGLPAGVTLENSTGTFDGNPFITIPGVTTLAPGQSVSVEVKFADPSHTLIKFTPTVYSGSL